MAQYIDKAAVVAEIEKRISRNKKRKEWEDIPEKRHQLIIEGQLLGELKHFLDTLEVKEANDAYKQGYNDAIDKFCEFMQNCEGYVVSGNKCNYDNFIKYMEEQQ